MLTGSTVGLRARHEEDIPVLRAELYDDVVYSSLADSDPWRPVPPGSKDSRLTVAHGSRVRAAHGSGF